MTPILPREVNPAEHELEKKQASVSKVGGESDGFEDGFELGEDVIGFKVGFELGEDVVGFKVGFEDGEEVGIEVGKSEGLPELMDAVELGELLVVGDRLCVEVG